jgi:hypothetical protein
LELLGDKIRLRPIEKSDIDDLYNWWNDPEFAGEYAGDYPKSRIEVEELVKGGWFFMIESRLEDKKIGFIAYYFGSVGLSPSLRDWIPNKAEREKEGLHDRSRTAPCRSPLYNEEGNRKNRVGNRCRECALPESVGKERVQARRGTEETVLQQRAVQK